MTTAAETSAQILGSTDVSRVRGGVFGEMLIRATPTAVFVAAPAFGLRLLVVECRDGSIVSGVYSIAGDRAEPMPFGRALA